MLEATQLHCSVGIGDTKVRAKIATEFGKPRGMFRLTRENWFAVMGHRPTKDLWGIGPRISERLAVPRHRDRPPARRDTRRAARSRSSAPTPARTSAGSAAASAANRVDDTPWIARAHGRETTYQQNLVTADEIDDAIRALADQVVEDIKAEGRACLRVHLKVRFAPFFTVNRSRKLAEPTFDADVIADAALDLLRKLEDDRPIRLLGVRAEMVPPEGGYDAPRTHGRRGNP